VVLHTLEHNRTDHIKCIVNQLQPARRCKPPSWGLPTWKYALLLQYCIGRTKENHVKPQIMGLQSVCEPRFEWVISRIWQRCGNYSTMTFSGCAIYSSTLQKYRSIGDTKSWRTHLESLCFHSCHSISSVPQFSLKQLLIQAWSTFDVCLI
jgi:hypothetical protein